MCGGEGKDCLCGWVWYEGLCMGVWGWSVGVR